MQQLTCYQIHALAPQIAPGRASRAWMDATPERFAYRCLPLSIANSMGWEVLSPCRITAEWNGGVELNDLKVEIEDDAWRQRQAAASHFGSGILTFHLGYLFRTEPGVGLWARGTPNAPKDGIAPLEGIIETDWLPFTFTMNWKLTRPGVIAFDKDEPFCFLTPIRYRALEEIIPEVVAIEENPALQADYEAWSSQRLDFNRRLTAREPDVVGQGWQKWYTQAKTPDGESRNSAHLTKLSLAAPRRKHMVSQTP
ncbi:MAG TPA: DUF6065 family protein [Methylocystis sp.]|nr:DUF6065 family protein [Methylocystis sp.]